MSAFRTGDTVHHIPSGEDWIVAVCQDGEVIPCGWPLSRADAADCALIKAASDEDHLYWLREIAKSQCDTRGAYARRVLAKRTPTPLTDSEREQMARSVRTSQALSGVTVSEDEARAALEQAERMPSARIGGGDDTDE